MNLPQKQKPDKGDAQLYGDNHSEGPKYPFDWSQSGIATLMPSKDNRKLTWFCLLYTSDAADE